MLFDDLDAATLSLRERRIGFVFQHYALFRHMTVLDNVAFGLRVVLGAVLRRERDQTAARELLELVQLAALGRPLSPAALRRPAPARVAWRARSPIEPRLLLLDEPFGALEPRSARICATGSREFHDRPGDTTLFVTHDQDEAFGLGHRVAILTRDVSNRSAPGGDL